MHAKVLPVPRSALENLPQHVSLHMSAYISDVQGHANLACTSSYTHTMFQSTTNNKMAVVLLHAIFMREKNKAVSIVQNNPNILFYRATYSMPVINADGRLAEHSEQIYHDVTPLELMFYTGDWQLCSIIIPLIPHKFTRPVLEIMYCILLGGPDIVKLKVDPRSLPWERLLHLYTTANKCTGYRLLSNPDGIICYQPNADTILYFYANQSCRTLELLTPTITTPADNTMFMAFQDNIKHAMLNYSSCRTTDNEHAMITRIFGITLVRYGIHYELDNIHYHDTQDNSHRLVNAYRRYKYICRERNVDTVENQTIIDHAWVNIIGKAQRQAMPHDMRIFLEEMPFDRVDSFDIEHFCGQNNNFTNWITETTDNLYPLRTDTGPGIDLGLIHIAQDSQWITCGRDVGAAEVVANYEINTILDVIKIRQHCFAELSSSFEERLRPTLHSCYCQ